MNSHLLSIFNLFSLLLLIIPGFYIRATSQDTLEAKEICTLPKVKTVLFYRSGWDLSPPVYFLNENESLEFRFDYLDRPEIDFAYTIKNCTYDWQINDIPEHYFLDGFNDLAFDNYDPSRNTTCYFTHYSLIIPNENIKILSSGNYFLVIHDRDDPSEVFLTRRFCVSENSTSITGLVRRPDNASQELSLQIDIGELHSSNPLSEVKVVILKNYDWNNSVPILSPPLLRDNIMHLDMPYQVLTQGGNEFRFFDTKSTKYDSERIDHIEYRPPYYCFILKPDEIKQYSPYFTSTDLNGRFYIDIPGARDRHLDSDYVKVEFSLNSQQDPGSDVFLYGAFANWTADESSQMTYNAENQRYEKTLLLKQGFYNYAYASRDTRNKSIRLETTEGDHSETENDFLIFIYYRKNTEDIDRLVGFTIINSAGKTKDSSRSPE
jgi:hypothetical protein